MHVCVCVIRRARRSLRVFRPPDFFQRFPVRHNCTMRMLLLSQTNRRRAEDAGVLQFISVVLLTIGFQCGESQSGSSSLYLLSFFFFFFFWRGGGGGWCLLVCLWSHSLWFPSLIFIHRFIHLFILHHFFFYLLFIYSLFLDFIYLYIYSLFVL